MRRGADVDASALVLASIAKALISGAFE